MRKKLQKRKRRKGRGDKDENRRGINREIKR